jgi:hypothetical protein
MGAKRRPAQEPGLAEACSIIRELKPRQIQLGVGLLDGPRRREAAGLGLVDHRAIAGPLWQAALAEAQAAAALGASH